MFKTIIVPLDGSPVSEQVLPKAAELARCSPDSKIILLEVIKPVGPSVIDALVLSNASEVPTLTPGEAKDYLRQVAAKHLSGIHVQILAEEGGAAEIILQTAKDNSADVIAMASHGRSGVARLTLGSVTSQVINHAEVPVLVVKAK
ncbi:Nucleotide-binding universal stress protein, UspA family [Dehalogenimonas formicexedens]|uniref:Nucleotide-binding universal stress protein, UspA family n=1 Tax=Dehalogenimonas formicexedens TaxID=1839801 RepID=A0A1P8F4V7_9CHLR|nr:universal stress protein [Dehalogenimonas formicexedens]APV43392.1 Nucleotide-binding universal stress protein, UspA family [Dehalogenimonas formicexedens]